MVEEKILIWKLNQQDTQVLHRIYEKYKNCLLTLAAALLNDRSTAEDVVHDVFVTLVKSPPKLRLSGNLKGYLNTCVANRARNVNRTAGRNKTVTIDCAAATPTPMTGPDCAAIFGEDLWLLNYALGQLPYEQKEVVLLHLHGEMTFKDIAKSQGASINTIQGRYRYGLKKLRSLLNGEVKK